MKRTARERNAAPPRVEKTETIAVSDRHVRLRLALTVAFVLLGGVFLTRAFVLLLSSEAGWQVIEANDTGVLHVGADFVFQYETGREGKSASAEYKALRSLYTELVQTEYRVYNTMATAYDAGNLCEVNRSPNTVVTVHPHLYAAFEKIVEAGERSVYLGPLYQTYQNLFDTEEDVLCAGFDPARNAEAAADAAALAAFAADPSSVSLELLGENRVRLFVSDEYLRYTADWGDVPYVDFGWLRNAFVIDDLADALTSAGYTAGFLVSCDGYTRNLDEGAYTYSLYDRTTGADASLRVAATLAYTGPTAFVYLHAYPLGEADAHMYHVYRDGTICTPYIDVRDGWSRTSLAQLVLYADGASCASLALAAAPSFLADTYRAPDADCGVVSIREGKITHTGNAALTIADDAYSLYP